jgi:hypothetical protein
LKSMGWRSKSACRSCDEVEIRTREHRFKNAWLAPQSVLHLSNLVAETSLAIQLSILWIHLSLQKASSVSVNITRVHHL